MNELDVFLMLFSDNYSISLKSGNVGILVSDDLKDRVVVRITLNLNKFDVTKFIAGKSQSTSIGIYESNDLNEKIKYYKEKLMETLSL